MSIVTLPAGLRGVFAEVGYSQIRYDMTESSDSTGHQAARVLAPPRWRVTLRSHEGLTLTEGGQLEAVLVKLRGRVNHLQLSDPVRSVPEGSMRGTPRIAGAAALPAGSTSVTLNCTAAGTLSAGDWMQFGTGLGTSQLVKVVEPCTSSPAAEVAFSWTNGGAFTWTNGGSFSWVDAGTVTVTFEPPTRMAFAADTAVTLEQPVGYFKQTSDSQWRYRPGRLQGGFALDLLEAFN